MAGSGNFARPASKVSGTIILTLFLILFFVLIVGLMWKTHTDFMSAQPRRQSQFHRGVVIRTLPDGKLYFVTAVGAQGADLAPCIGAGCTIQGWSAERLQKTTHNDVYPGDPNYGDVMALFAKQPEPSTF